MLIGTKGQKAGFFPYKIGLGPQGTDAGSHTEYPYICNYIPVCPVKTSCRWRTSKWGFGGNGVITQWWKHWLLSQRTKVLLPLSTQQLTTICNSRSRGPKILIHGNQSSTCQVKAWGKRSQIPLALPPQAAEPCCRGDTGPTTLQGCFWRGHPKPDLDGLF